MRRIVGAMLVSLAVACAFALGGSCYSVPEPDCGFVCGAGGACPEDYLCGSGSICRRIGAPMSTVCKLDAGPIDAAIVSPMVVSTVPIDGATMVSRSAPITATFNQPLEDDSVSIATFLVTTAGGVQVPGTVTMDDPSMTATFTPTSELPAGAQLTVSLTGNITSAMNAPLEPLTFTFTTIDDEPPTLVASSPLDMATAVPDASVIAITFSEPVTGVDATSFAVAAAAPIAGTITGSGASYTFTPTAAFPVATHITVSLSGAIADLAGNSLLPVSFGFTTK
jgi:hypothetical protein